MPSKTDSKIEFPGARGALLAARLDIPVLEPRAYALFAHCFTCSKDIAAAVRISRGLAARGYAVLRFDFTGLGHSGGEFANTNFSSNVQDLVRAADWLRENREAPALLIGHSLGGAAVLAAAHAVPEAKAVVTIGAPSDPGHLENVLAPARKEIEEKGEAEVFLGGRSFRIEKQFLEDIREQRLEDHIGRLRKALLVLHAVTDDVVGIDHATAIFKAARHPKSFISLDQADHLVSKPADAEFVAEVIASWASRYVPAAEEPEAADQGEVIVEETGFGKFSQEITAGPHTLLGDEPRKVGGDDTGPTPYGFLLAALGSCTSMTLRMYADHKGLDLDPVRVRLRHEKIHAQDCEDCETKAGKIDVIEREITVSGDLTDEQRKRLLEIADRCPVHRTLGSEIRIVTHEGSGTDGERGSRA